MENNTPRRLFLRNTVMATAGIALLSTNPILGALTSEQSPANGYDPYASFSKDLRKGLFSEHTVSIRGKILHRDLLTPEANALVEVWHLSPGSQKFGHKGKLTTDASGSYQFKTDFPNGAEGKLPVIYFKITAGSRSYVTQLILGTQAAFIKGDHWEQNQSLGEDRFPKLKRSEGRSDITFNISL